MKGGVKRKGSRVREGRGNRVGMVKKGRYGEKGKVLRKREGRGNKEGRRNREDKWK